ncbi:methyltransferase domain-containing protein [Nocardia sp. NPDC004604]|uniref:class I SAM-dependent methyltransferase n=1 Tax=Nocardia sp. NPDC004604 TaxID=3157013 RepID=UPI0033A0AB32
MAEQYERTRPSYPEDLIDEILGDSVDALSVLDVGSGTGIATRQIAKRGAQVLGVDMSPGMAEIAERHGIATEVVPFETWDPAGRTFDRVISAQAWHWMDPITSAAKAAAMLRPGGRLCLFWNIGHHPDDLADALHAAYRRVLPPDAARLTIGYAINRSSDLPADFSVITGSPHAFEHMTEEPIEPFPWSHTYTRDQWLDQLYSHSDHTALADDVRQNLFDEIGSTIDRFGGTFAMTFTTFLISATMPR